MNKKEMKKNVVPYILLVVLMLVLLYIYRIMSFKTYDLTYNEFIEKLDNAKIIEMTIVPRSGGYVYDITGTLDGYVRIGLHVVENEFPDDGLSYRIFNSEGELFLSGTISSLDSYTLADNIFMRSGESASYTIQIWLEENGEQQNKSRGKKMVAAIEVTETQIIE